MRTQALFVRNAALASLIALCAASTGFAQTAAPANGLGQAWPNASDVSANPNWHVYVFVLHGVKYIQVNDLNGTVHAAVGIANGSTAVLPMGVDSQNVSTTPSSTASSTTQTVYSDATTTVTATPQSNGTMRFTALDCPNGCGGNG